MPLLTDNTNEIPIIKIQGELDIKTALNFKTEIINLILEGKFEIKSDLSELDHIDSAGIGVFLSTTLSLNKLGGSFTLINPQMHIKDLLDSTQVIKILNVEEV